MKRTARKYSGPVRSLLALLLVAFTVDSLNLPDAVSRNHPMLCSSDDVALVSAGRQITPDVNQDDCVSSFLPRKGNPSVPVLEQTVLVDEDSPVQIEPASGGDFVAQDPMRPACFTNDPVPPSAPIYLRLRSLLI